MEIVIRNSLKRLQQKELNTRPKLDARTATLNIRPQETVLFQSAACAMLTKPIMNWRTAGAATQTHMPPWILPWRANLPPLASPVTHSRVKKYRIIPATAHRVIPVCMDCHEKHAADMDFEACKSCHPVHMPLVIAYASETPSHYCGACHEDAMTLLQANTTKHHDLACTTCHPDKHKAIEQCTDCHGVPHPARMIQKFPKCGDCHGIAHDLR
ncbi:MAG: hypothetical protein JRI70_11915 [Deltaproteobacteria bacterium]|nr:hypothetical protein [Deltaproteobacteria bacterium]